MRSPIRATFCCAPGAGRVNQLLLGLQTPSSLTLSWQGSCSEDDDDYAVYSGEIGAFTSHTLELCTTSGLPTTTLPLPDGSRYYLVVPLDGLEEGSYGTDGAGAERPVGLTTCGPQHLAAGCP